MHFEHDQLPKVTLAESLMERCFDGGGQSKTTNRKREKLIPNTVAHLSRIHG